MGIIQQCGYYSPSEQLIIYFQQLVLKNSRSFSLRIGWKTRVSINPTRNLKCAWLLLLKGGSLFLLTVVQHGISVYLSYYSCRDSTAIVLHITSSRHYVSWDTWASRLKFKVQVPYKMFFFLISKLTSQLKYSTGDTRSRDVYTHEARSKWNTGLPMNSEV